MCVAAGLLLPCFTNTGVGLINLVYIIINIEIRNTDNYFVKDCVVVEPCFIAAGRKFMVLKKMLHMIKQERGALVVFTALLLPVIFGFAGLAVDVGVSARR